MFCFSVCSVYFCLYIYLFIQVVRLIHIAKSARVFFLVFIIYLLNGTAYTDTTVLFTALLGFLNSILVLWHALLLHQLFLMFYATLSYSILSYPISFSFYSF